jgi:hypothetical protein
MVFILDVLLRGTSSDYLLDDNGPRGVESVDLIKVRFGVLLAARTTCSIENNVVEIFLTFSAPVALKPLPILIGCLHRFPILLAADL